MSQRHGPLEVIAKARSALGKGIKYKLGRGGYKPAAGSPASSGECDCSGFIAWCLGIPRNLTDPFYLKANGGWFETSAICEDLRSPAGLFERLSVPRSGCVAVYADHAGQQGHIGLVSQVADGRVLKVIHCSASAWRNSGDAIAENSAPALTGNPAILYGWFAGYGGSSKRLAKPADKYRVAASALNLRSAPADLSPSAVLATLPRNHAVVKLAETSKSLWWKVSVVVHRKRIEGYVNASFLTEYVPRWRPVKGVPRAIVVDPHEVIVTERALQMILDFEGMDQPSKWPGEMSGTSIGHGYDLGYHTYDEFMGDWGDFLGMQELQLLATAIGKRGAAAHDMAKQFADIRIHRIDADKVFMRATLPKTKLWAGKTFHGITRLPPDAQGALVSLVYNRGTDMNGERRREMREIRDTIADDRLAVPEVLLEIAASLRSMKRLWPAKRGLQRRREAEAVMVEMASFQLS